MRGDSIKKICFVHGGGYNAFKDKSVGGTQLQLYFISTALAENEEYEVQFITKTEDCEKLEGVELVPGIGKTNNFINKLHTGLKLTFSLIQADADIYFSSNSNIDVFLIGLICFMKNKKHFHRTVHERQVNKTWLKQEPPKGILNHIGMRQADTIFTQSRDHYEKLSDWFDPDLEMLPNSFPLNTRGRADGDYILWVGRRVKWKRPDLVLDLAEEFDSEDFVVISPKKSGNRKFYHRIEERASRINNVELIERVPRDQIQKYFDCAKIFINTSEAEGFPNTFIEAGKGSTPILSYKVDPDSFIELKKCGFSCNGDYRDLKSKLKLMLREKEERVNRGKNCREYVEENHDISKNISIIEKRIEIVE